MINTDGSDTMALNVYSWWLSFIASRFQIQDSHHYVLSFGREFTKALWKWSKQKQKRKREEKKRQITIWFLNNKLMFVSYLFSVFFFHCFVCHADEAISHKGHRKNWKQCRSNTHESFTYFQFEMWSYRMRAHVHTHWVNCLLQLHT